MVKARKLLQIPAPDYVNSIDLKASKLIMTSSSWPDKFYENHYLFKASFGKPYGVLFGGGKYYKRASKLAFKLLHQFEFFKPSRMEGLVVFEATEAAAALEQRVAAAAIPAEKDNPDHMQEEGKDGRKWLTLCPHTMFERNTLNIIWQVVASSRFDKDDDPIFEKLMALMNRFNRTFELPNSILEVFPILRHFPSLTVLGSLYECSNFYYKVFRVIPTANQCGLMGSRSAPISVYTCTSLLFCCAGSHCEKAGRTWPLPTGTEGSGGWIHFGN